MTNHREVDSLILLVGSNPLPNYLAAMALKPSKIHLVYSQETEKPKDRLRAALIDDLGTGVQIDGDAYIDDPFSVSAVRDKIRDLMSAPHATHLNYTGGTKVMSAHALNAFYEKKGQPGHASYFDEGQRCLRFDDGNSRELLECGVQLRLDRILQLHGVTQKPRSTIEGGPNSADVLAIATAVLQRPQLASCLYGERKRLEDGSFKDAKEMPFDPSSYGLSLSAHVIPPNEGMIRKCFETWYKLLGGEWLEEHVARIVNELQLDNDPEIVTGINCERSDPEGKFEVDVAVIRGQRSYFISCTTDMTRSICKSKAFEILVRSRHMGGDLSRSALVSLLPSNVVEDLRKDIASAWGSNISTKIFGLEDVRKWSGHDGSPNLDGLREWLDS